MSIMEKSCRLLAAGLAAGVVASVLAACSAEPPPAGKGPADKDGPATVVMATVAAREFAQPVDGIATLRAREAVTLTAPASGRVRAILFREGAHTPAGAALLRLEDDEERAELAAAEANAGIERNRFARMHELLGKGLVSREEHDTAAQALAAADARLRLARVRVELRTLRAPFAGVLGFRQVSEGALVQPGNPIVTLDAIDSLRADFAVPETLAGLLVQGTQVTARSAAWPQQAFTGTITLVDTRVDPGTRAVTVQARIDNRDRKLKPGMLLTMNAPARPRTALFVPEAALLPENARQYAWRVNDAGQAARVEVSTGVRRDGEVEIVAGLAAGDRVVVEGQGNLREGRSVVARATGGNAP